MDIKIAGIDRYILEQALAQAHKGRMFILEKMMAAISSPRPELSKFAPRVISIRIHPDKIRDVIGPGGRVINKIIEETGVKIDIEQDGRVFISGTDSEGTARAREMIENITREVEVGKVYLGKVTRVEKYGAFVEVLPGKEGLVHVSQVDAARINRVEDVCVVGDHILVKVTEIDSQGRVNLSRKEALREVSEADVKGQEDRHPQPAAEGEQPARTGSGGPGGGFGGSRGPRQNYDRNGPRRDGQPREARPSR
jgi:polyribonucleotide nucleotidyltransferase